MVGGGGWGAASGNENTVLYLTGTHDQGYL